MKAFFSSVEIAEDADGDSGELKLEFAEWCLREQKISYCLSVEGSTCCNWTQHSVESEDRCTSFMLVKPSVVAAAKKLN